MYKNRNEQWVRRLVSARIPQKEIAEFLNLSEARVSQIKGELRDRGLLDSGGGESDSIQWSKKVVW
jgi:CRP-like cAMP-binding protein